MLFIIFIEGPEDEEGEYNRIYSLPTSGEELDRVCEYLDSFGVSYDWRQVL